MAEQLRKMSRYKYLKMRTQMQLELWKRRIEDEAKLFQDVELTQEEVAINELNRKNSNVIKYHLWLSLELIHHTIG